MMAQNCFLLFSFCLFFSVCQAMEKRDNGIPLAEKDLKSFVGKEVLYQDCNSSSLPYKKGILGCQNGLGYQDDCSGGFVQYYRIFVNTSKTEGIVRPVGKIYRVQDADK